MEVGEADPEETGHRHRWSAPVIGMRYDETRKQEEEIGRQIGMAQRVVGGVGEEIFEEIKNDHGEGCGPAEAVEDFVMPRDMGADLR